MKMALVRVAVNLRWYDYIGWAGTILVLSAYATGSIYIFSLANALLFVPVALPAIYRRAWNAVAISCTFGIIGIITVIRWN